MSQTSLWLHCRQELLNHYNYISIFTKALYNLERLSSKIACIRNPYIVVVGAATTSNWCTDSVTEDVALLETASPVLAHSCGMTMNHTCESQLYSQQELFNNYNYIKVCLQKPFIILSNYQSEKAEFEIYIYICTRNFSPPTGNDSLSHEMCTSFYVIWVFLFNMSLSRNWIWKICHGKYLSCVCKTPTVRLSGGNQVFWEICGNFVNMTHSEIWDYYSEVQFIC